jgi:hypothetical protein
MDHSQKSIQCAKGSFLFKDITSTDAAWIAIGTMIPIMLFSGTIIFIAATGDRPQSVQRRRFFISTALLLLIGLLAFFLNIAFMHIKDCDPPAPENLASVASLSIFGGDVAAGVALLAWLIRMYCNIKVWRKEQKRRALEARGRIDNQKLQDRCSIPVANREISRCLSSQSRKSNAAINST